jgi:hypothetical protein
VGSQLGSLFLPAFSGNRDRGNSRLMISAVTRKPAQGLDQFQSQFYTTGINLETALEDFTLTTDNIKKAAGGLSVEYIAPLILYFFKTTATTLFAATVPIGIFNG